MAVTKPTVPAAEQEAWLNKLVLPPIPESWAWDPTQVQATNEAAQAKINSTIQDNAGSAKRPAEDTGKASNVERMFDNIAKSGGHMDAKSKDANTFAKKWLAELNINEKLKADFAKEGKEYSRQRAFKAKWAAMQAEKIRRVRTASEWSDNLESIDGEYCTLARIVSRERNDAPAYKTACLYTASAVALWHQGKSCKGHPWVKYDDMRRQAVILHVRERIKIGHGQRWETRVEELPEDPQPTLPTAAASSNGNGGGDETQPGSQEPERAGDEQQAKRRRTGKTPENTVF